MFTQTKDPLALAAGDLRHSVNLLQQTTTTDESGVVQTYTPFLIDVRCKIEPFRGTDLIKSGQVATQTFITVTMRYVPGITSQMQVQRFDGRTYVIQSIENVLERNRVLKLLCLGLGGNN